jgi:SSS family solute:Na+ symporter
VNAIYTIPFILALSTAGCLLGTLLTAAEDDAVLTSFYRTVRPWGCWGPIRDKVMAEDPSFVPNGDFRKDATNVAVGIVWQVSLAALPIYIVLRDWRWAGAIAAVTATTSVFLKFNWYDKLERA